MNFILLLRRRHISKLGRQVHLLFDVLAHELTPHRDALAP